MLGDMNVDLAKNKMVTRHLQSCLSEFDLSQLISQPTRVTKVTSSIIDHIYTNNANLFHHNGVVDPGLSDHGLVFVTRNMSEIPRKRKRCMYVIIVSLMKCFLPKRCLLPIGVMFFVPGMLMRL